MTLATLDSPPSPNLPSVDAPPPRPLGVGLRLVMLALMGLLVFFNYLLWVPPGRGVQALHELQLAIAQQEAINERLQRRNGSLEAEVNDLRDGLGAIEERARVELGMIRKDETFFLILDEYPPILPSTSPLE